MVERYRPRRPVGYRHPPEHSRFKKGVSGNRKGRPKRVIGPPRPVRTGTEFHDLVCRKWRKS